jgi:hypothetical protein
MNREVKGKHNQLKMCNEIYAKAFELEKQKHLEERSNQMELRRAENDEKNSIFLQVGNFYKDKMSMLKEIYRKEKYESEIEYRAKTQVFARLQKDTRNVFKKQVEHFFDSIEEENRRMEGRNTDRDGIENLLIDYYKKVH